MAGVDSERIVFFDGVCNLCNGFVDFLVRHDGDRRLKFASLQGETAARRLPEPARQSLSTVVFLDNGQLYFESTAVLRVMAVLPAPWSWLKIALVLPKWLRNLVYRCVARYRYRIFGRRDSCRLPTAEEKAVFLP